MLKLSEKMNGRNTSLKEVKQLETKNNRIIL